jgi:dimeric dUTPase (all-alpha-NTP-PPase superfamily)
MTKFNLALAVKPRLYANERNCFSNWTGRHAAPRDPEAVKAELIKLAPRRSFGRRQTEKLR